MIATTKRNTDTVKAQHVYIHDICRLLLGMNGAEIAITIQQTAVMEYAIAH